MSTAKNRLVRLALPLCLGLLFSNCGPGRARGQWIQEPTQRDDAFFALRFVDANHGFLVGWNGFSESKIQGWTVLTSDDSGLTWKPLPGQEESKIRTAFFLSPQTGWGISLENDLLRTDNGGSLWTLQRKAGQVQAHNDALPKKVQEMPDPVDHLQFIDALTGWAWGGGRQQAGFSMPGMFLRTTDGGANWQPLGFPFSNELAALQFIDSLHGWACELKGACYKSDDGGRSWAKMNTREGFSGNAVSFNDAQHGWIVGNGGYLLRTRDGGRSWSYRGTREHRDLRDVCFLSVREGWIVGNSGAILYTRNEGDDWQRFTSPVTTDLTHVQFLNPQLGWIAGNNGVLLRYTASR